MKKLILSILLLLLTVGCGTIKPIPVETVINYKDSTIINVVDSTVYIPVERIVDIVPVYDTLHLETTKATADAWVDTTMHVLRGKIENKTGIEYKYIYKDRIEYRDSIVTQDIPVEVEVEKIVKTHFWYEKILWILSLLAGVMIGRKLYPIIKKWLAIL